MTSPVQSGPGACVTSFSGYFTKKNPAGLIILRVLQSNLKLMTAFYMATTSNLFYSAKTSTRAQTAPLFLLRPRSRPHIHPYYYRSFCNVGKHARMSRSVTHRRRLRLRRVRGLRVRSSARTHVQQGNNRRAASEGGAARAASLNRPICTYFVPFKTQVMQPSICSCKSKLCFLSA